MCDSFFLSMNKINEYENRKNKKKGKTTHL